MVEIGANLTGDISAALDKFEKKIKTEVMLSGVAAMALPVYEELKLNTSPPRMGRVTGNMHNAVYRAYSPERSNDERQIYHVGVNKAKAPHWHFFELGTSKMPARPFIRPAFESRKDEAIKAGMKRMEERLK